MFYVFQNDTHLSWSRHASTYKAVICFWIPRGTEGCQPSRDIIIVPAGKMNQNL